MKAVAALVVQVQVEPGRAISLTAQLGDQGIPLQPLTGTGAPGTTYWGLAAIHALATPGYASLDLRWQDVDMDAMMIHPRGGHAKKRRASVPINTSLAIALSESLAIADSEYLVSWNRKKIGSVQTAFEAAVERAGLEDVRIHDLRRTCATWMRQRGVSLAEVAAVLGDEVRTVERHYAKHGPDYLRDATGSIG